MIKQTINHVVIETYDSSKTTGSLTDLKATSRIFLFFGSNMASQTMIPMANPAGIAYKIFKETLTHENE